MFTREVARFLDLLERLVKAVEELAADSLARRARQLDIDEGRLQPAGGGRRKNGTQG